MKSATKWIEIENKLINLSVIDRNVWKCSKFNKNLAKVSTRYSKLNFKYIVIYMENSIEHLYFVLEFHSGNFHALRFMDVFVMFKIALLILSRIWT